MAWFAKGLVVAACAAGLGGCALSPPMTGHPYPVYGNPVNPTPAPGYRVICTAVPGATYLFDQNFGSSCYQVVPTTDVIISTRG